jgi:hypothetical protein
MNETVNCSAEGLIVQARRVAGKETLNDASRHFPSYLLLFGIFFELLLSESLWGGARLLVSCCGRFSTAQAHVAFL